MGIIRECNYEKEEECLVAMIDDTVWAICISNVSGERLMGVKLNLVCAHTGDWCSIASVFVGESNVAYYIICYLIVNHDAI